MAEVIVSITRYVTDLEQAEKLNSLIHSSVSAPTNTQKKRGRKISTTFYRKKMSDDV